MGTNKKLIRDSAMSLARSMRISFSNTGEHFQDMRSIASTHNNWYLAVIVPLLRFIFTWHYSHGFSNCIIPLCILQVPFTLISTSLNRRNTFRSFLKSRKVFLHLSISEHQTARLIETSITVTQGRGVVFSATPL
jgi:hypothetical protein